MISQVGFLTFATNAIRSHLLTRLPIALCLSLLTTGSLFGCKNYGQRVEYLVLPNIKPKQQSADAQLRLAVKRVNAQAWWKICVVAWVDGFSDQRRSLGCNTDTQLSAPVELPARTTSCNTLQFSFSVFKNTSPCSGDRPNCSHESSPAHTRDTSNPADQRFFRTATGPELSFPFPPGPLADIRIPPEYEAEYRELSASDAGSNPASKARIFLEDQTDSNLAQWQTTGDWKTTGVDFFDYVIEISSPQAPFSIGGGTKNNCEQTAASPQPQ
jgi:hypothetical protein